jgi:hypothetical protein
LDSESAMKIGDRHDWRQTTELQGTWLPGQNLACTVLNQVLLQRCGCTIANAALYGTIADDDVISETFDDQDLQM